MSTPRRLSRGSAAAKSDHSAEFTLSTYVHLLDEDVGAPLELSRPRPASKDRPAVVAA
jgi:hypothetical protein